MIENTKERLLQIKQSTINQKSIKILTENFEFCKEKYFEENQTEIKILILKNFEFLANENVKIANRIAAEILINLIDQIECWAEEKVSILLLISTVARICPRAIHPQWKKLIPGMFQLSNLSKTTIYKVIIQLFTNSQKYCQMARHSDNRSFTSLSQELADQIDSTLKYLIMQIVESTRDGLLFQALSAVIENSPLLALKGDYPWELFLWIKDLLAHQQENRQLIWKMLQGIVFQINSHSTPSTTLYKYNESNGTRTSEELNATHKRILQETYQLILSETNPNPVVNIALMDLIKALSLCPLIEYDSSIFSFLSNGMKLDSIQCLAAFHALETFCRHMQDHFWWNNYLEMTTTFYKSSISGVRATLCEILCHVPEPVLNTSKLKIFLFLTVLSFTGDSDQDVKISACSCLGVFVNMKIFATELYLTDCVNAILPLCEDANLKIRVKAFWTLGNLASSLESRKILLEDDSIISLLQALTDGCRDHDRVKPHAFRALGFLSKRLSPVLIHKSSGLLGKAIENLLKTTNTGSFKVRWNACHCIRHILSNPDFPTDRTYFTKELYTTLSEVARDSLNFKVKTSAILALAAPKCIKLYEYDDTKGIAMLDSILDHLEVGLINIELVLAKSTYEEQNYLHSFLNAIDTIIQHFQGLVLDMKDSTKQKINQITALKYEILHPKKSSFDSTRM